MKRKTLLLLFLSLFLSSCTSMCNPHSCDDCIDKESTMAPYIRRMTCALNDRIITSDGYDFCITYCHFDGDILSVTFKGHFEIQSDAYFRVEIIFNTTSGTRMSATFNMENESIALVKSSAYETKITNLRTVYSIKGELTLKYIGTYGTPSTPIKNVDFNNVFYISYAYSDYGYTAKGRIYNFFHEEYYND